MTATAPITSSTRRRTPAPLLRAGLWSLHLTVVVLAVTKEQDG